MRKIHSHGSVGGFFGSSRKVGNKRQAALDGSFVGPLRAVGRESFADANDLVRPHGRRKGLEGVHAVSVSRRHLGGPPCRSIWPSLTGRHSSGTACAS